MLPLKDADPEELYTLDCVLFQREQWSKAEFDRFFDSGVGYVEYDAGRIIAYAIFRPDPQLSELVRLGVVEDHRRQGLAKQLVQRGFDELSDTTQAVFLTVRLSNEGAIKLYRQLGFIPHGVRRKYYRDGEHGIVFVKW